MGEIAKKDGFRYSLEPFDGYAFRARVKLKTKHDGDYELDIYTDSNNGSGDVLNFLLSLKKDIEVSVEFTRSKDYDDRVAELIDGLF